MNVTTFSSYIKDIPSAFRDFEPFAKASDRDAWEKLPRELTDYILKEAIRAESKIKGEGWPLLPASLWTDFYRTGNRTAFEDCYFSRRTLLMILVLAECIEHTGRYLSLITDGIFLICEESAWQLPAHNSYIRDTPQLPYPDASRPIFDLFAGETTNLLSCIWRLLKEDLDSDSPMICERIRQELDRRIINPYLNSHFWWMGNDDEPMCNWTPWCTQNALLTAFILPYDDETRTKVLQKALYSMDCFLKDYGEDGCCSEGAEYYRHAALTFFNAMDIMNCTAGEFIKDIYSLPQIKNIAEYIMNMNIPHTEYFFNFADCSPLAGKSGAREYLFGKAVGSERLCSFAREQWNSSSVTEKLLDLNADKLSQSNIYYTLQSLFCNFDPDSQAAEKAEGAETEESECTVCRYDSVGVFIVNAGRFCTAAKAGGNGDSHNHNDTGSFIVYRDGKPVFIDVGVENYTKKTFSPQRYEIWTMQSAFHNLPEVNGVMQKDGAGFCARDTKVSGTSVSMDIAGAYPLESGLKNYIRTINTEKDCFSVTDTWKVEGSENTVVHSLMLREKPLVQQEESEEGTVFRLTGEDGWCCRITARNSSINMEEIHVSDSRLRRMWPEKLYRVLIKCIKTEKITFFLS